MTEPASSLHVCRTNTILYCERWEDTVAFYRDTLGLEVSFRHRWLIEFVLGGEAHLSVADRAHTTIASSHGAGITLSWKTVGLAAVRRDLEAKGMTVPPIRRRWDTDYIEIHDPEGTRIELWADPPPTVDPQATTETATT